MTSTNLQIANLQNLDLSHINDTSCWLCGSLNMETLDMSNAIFPENSSSFFSGGPGYYVRNLVLKNIDTSKVSDMSNMFSRATNIQELDLSDFNTSNVINMNNMFANTTNLQSITFGPNFVHKPEATTTGMFTGCPAPERPTDDSWTDVSFD